MPVFNNALAGAAGSGGAAAYEIERSLRFNSGDSAYLDRTPSSAGNRKTWTWSGWIKTTTSSTYRALIEGYGGTPAGANRTSFQLNNVGKLHILFDNGNSGQLLTSGQFRDPSSWFHVVLAVDTSQSTAADRVKIYVNGRLLESGDYDTAIYPSQNYDTGINNNQPHYINRVVDPKWGDWYAADIHLVDGQQLAATDFGESDADTGVWNPKRYSGSHGTNGFHLDFSDDSSNAALGTDSSGNNNTWTVTNLTSGASLASQGFEVATWTGTGSSQSIALPFQPDFVWIKQRNEIRNNLVFDSVRGATKFAVTNSTGAPGTIAQGLTSFNSNGFTVGTADDVNKNAGTYVAWCFKAGGAASSNTDGNISASVSASTQYGFSVVEYTGDGATNGSVGHGLGSTPQMVIVKRTNGANDWKVRHTSLGSTEMLSLNQTYGAGTAGWNGETSSVFYPARSGDTYNNLSGATYIAYCWSEVPGFSKFGSWTGNGSTSGPTITLGFKPRFVLFKRSDQAGDSWTIFDTARDSGALNIGLEPNSNAAEQTYTNRSIVVSGTGFQVTSTGSSSNANGGTYIYAAFAEGSNSDIDSLLDSPTNYEADTGNNGGNYCVLNPLDQLAAVLSNGNLEAEVNEDGARFVRGTIAVSSGKWYWEYTVLSGTSMALGVVETTGTGNITNSQSYYYYRNGTLYGNTSGVNGSWGGSSLAVGDVLGVALDMDNGTLKFYKNGTLIGTAWTGLQGKTVAPAIGNGGGNNNKTACNFGQRQFSISSVPTGYKSLCTQNLPDPLIADSSTAFDTSLWTGNGSTQSITGLSFSPDLVWYKSRSDSYWHGTFDTVRGVNNGIFSNSSQAETNYTAITAFNSDGYTLGNKTDVNANNSTYVGWAWDAGSSTVSNTDGSITSSVRANQTAGFSIVGFTATNTNNATVGHGLNAAPELIILKNRDSSEFWWVIHKYMHASPWSDHTLRLNTTDSVTGVYATFNNVAPTSSVINLSNTTSPSPNQGTDDKIMYCFAPVAGFSAFGSYEGNGSADGPFIYTGFRVKYLLQKRTDSSGSWAIKDAAREPYNVVDTRLYADGVNADMTQSSFHEVDFLSNGFKVRSPGGSEDNASGGSFIYAAFAENPFKTARAR